MPISVAVSGATGRMGSVITDLVAADDAFTLHAALDSSSSPDELDGADVLIDATRIDVSERLVDEALARGLDVVVGTSGWDATRLDALATRIPADRGVIVVPNFSLGSVLGTMLSTIAARHFDSIEIIEAHHAGKIDSPSGTAVRTAELVAQARDGRPPEAPFVDQRARGQLVAGVPVHSLRMQGVVARQEVRFGGEGEELTITHVTHSNDSYRAGIRAALEAVSGLEGLVVGLEHVIGLTGASGALRA